MFDLQIVITIPSLSMATRQHERLAAQLGALERDFVKRSTARGRLELPKCNKEADGAGCVAGTEPPSGKLT